MSKGQVRFCCDDPTCEMAQNVAKVILNFVRVQLSLYQNADLLISLHHLGLEKEQILQFKVKSHQSNKWLL